MERYEVALKTVHLTYKSTRNGALEKKCVVWMGTFVPRWTEKKVVR